MRRTSNVILSSLAALAVTASGVRAAEKAHVSARLVSEAQSIQPGHRVWVGVELRHAAGWHTYWKNPGDSGLTTEIAWTLPAGYVAGEIQWPYPSRINAGPLTSYGYTGPLLLPVEITAPATASGSVPLAAKVTWLECSDICIPGSADVSLTLPVKDAPPLPNAKVAEAFADAHARAALSAKDLGWTFAGRFDDHTIEIEATPPAGLAESVGHVDLYPESGELIQHAAAQEWSDREKPFRLRVPRTAAIDRDPGKLAGVLVSSNGWRGLGSPRALAIDVELVRAAQPIPTAVATPPPASEPPASAPAAEPSFAAPTVAPRELATRSLPSTLSATGTVTSVGTALLFAFLGGLVLNLMPCVFPVLSIKVIGFVQQGHQHRGRAIEHALIFALGVLVSFWVIAGALIGLRLAGDELGWGFQLQSPPFVIALAALFFTMALNLFDVFEITGAVVSSAAASASARSGMLGSFLSGCLATVVATPCTAPFMGAALGFALAQPPLVSLAIFTTLGVGMALPYVILVSSPRLLRLVPRPGDWMRSLRHAMGFLLLATVVWLAWVLGQQAGLTAVTGLLGGLWLIGVGLWIAGRWGTIVASNRSRLLSRLAAVTLTAFGLWLAISRVDPECSAAVPGSDNCPVSFRPPVDGPGPAKTVHWDPWSEERVTQARAEGRPVLVDFTAAWCLSCQVNERVALGSSSVRSALLSRNVVTLRADWTHRDPAITRALAARGRSGVPVYLLYSAGSSSDPTLLPEVLTPQIVIDALSQAG